MQISILKVLRSPDMRKFVLFCLIQYYHDWFANELMVCVSNTNLLQSTKCCPFKVIKIYQITLFLHRLFKIWERTFEFDLFCTLHIQTLHFYWAWLSGNVINLFSVSFCFFWSIYKVSPWSLIFILMRKCA